MLIKLLKYDFRAAAPMFGVGYAVLLALAVLTVIFDGLNNTLNAILGSLYISLIFVVIVVTWVALCIHFYRNLLGSEGYLMHTLPVRGRYLILSKLISSVVWCIASGVVTFVSLMIVVLSTMGSRKDFFEGVASLCNTMFQTKLDVLSRVIQSSVMCLLEVALFLMIFYFAFLLSHMLPRFRGLAAAGIIIALLWGITTVCEKCFNAIFGPETNLDNELLRTFSICFLALLFLAVLFALSAWLLERKLNLQ